MKKAIVKMFKVENEATINQCYLIYRNNKGILIDPAWNYALINDFLIENKIELKAILLTHSHHDHTNLAEKISTNNNNIPILMSNEEADYYGFKMINLNKVYHLKEIKISVFTILPIVTPGHTEGSTCYLIEDNLFSGDTVFIEGVGICEPQNTEKLYNSVQFLKGYLPNNTVYWPGHSFGESTGKDQSFLLENNIYYQFDDKDAFIKFRNRKNRPKSFIFK